MKTHAWTLTFILTAILALTGCSRPSSPDAASSSESKKNGSSTSQTLVDGLTGRTAVRAGKKARTQIEDLRAQQHENLSEIMDDNK